MNIAVIGTGYVGLVTGACFAGSGNNVVCVDIDKEKIELLQKGTVPFYEPGLEEMVRTNLSKGRLRFSVDIAEAVRSSSIIFIAVGTPQDGDGSADVSAVLDVADKIGEYMNDYKIVVTKSTVPVGTTELVREKIKEKTRLDFDIASNPEFLKEGAAVEDFLKPDRVVIGVDKESVGQTLKDLYAPFMRSGDKAVIVSIRSSELSKYASNAMLATRISFMNEMANLCEKVGADVSEVRTVMGFDRRIGRHFLYAGIGYGGSCFPKDVKALINTARKFDYELKVCKAVDEVNNLQRVLFFNKILDYFGGDIEGKFFGVWGLSFKANTDDIREAPSLFIIDNLLKHKAKVIVHDPSAMDNVKKIFNSKVEYAESNYDACRGVDALVIHTEWNEYRQPDFELMSQIMKSKVIFDGRNLYDPCKLAQKGFKYFGVGIKV